MRQDVQLQEVRGSKTELKLNKPLFIRLETVKYDYILEQLHTTRVLNSHMRAKIT